MKNLKSSFWLLIGVIILCLIPGNHLTARASDDGEVVLTYVEIAVVDIASGDMLEGAALQLLTPDNIVLEEWISTGEPHVLDGLEANAEYIIHTRVAPDGYALSPDITFTIDGAGNVFSSCSMSEDGVLLVEEEKTAVGITVTDIASGEELPGAMLQILDSWGNVIDEWVSFSEPRFIEGLSVEEAYILHEVVAPEGYTLSPDITFMFDETGRVTTSGTMNEEGVLLVENTAPRIEIDVVDIANGEGLAGAWLVITDTEGITIAEWISEHRPHRVEGLRTGVEYIVREPVVPEGYTLGLDISFMIDETGHVTASGSMTEEGVLLVENARTRVEIDVVDIANGDYLPGVALMITDREGMVIEEWVSTDGSHIVEGLSTGMEYVLRETVPPEGYMAPQDAVFSIDAAGRVESSGKLTEMGALLVENELADIEERPLVLPGQLTAIEEEAFAGGTFTHVYLPEGMQTIGSRAFGDCQELRYISIPESVTEIAGDAFENCGGITVECRRDSEAYRFAAEKGFIIALK